MYLSHPGKSYVDYITLQENCGQSFKHSTIVNYDSRAVPGKGGQFYAH